MKSGANVEIEVAWAVIGHSRSSAMSQFDRTHTTFYSTLKRNYASILYRFRDIASCLSKVADFNLPDLTYPFGDPAGGDPSRMSQDRWQQKTRVIELSCGFVCVILCPAILTQYRLVTDGRTDGQTQDDSIHRASIASLGKN